MSFEYVRHYYGVPAKRGMRVELTANGESRLGTITSATHYVHVRFDGSNHSVPLHPTDEGLRYLPPAHQEPNSNG